MKVRPILMNVPMTRALAGGRKSHTRRVIKPQPLESCVLLEPRSASDVAEWASSDSGTPVHSARCPYGAWGDLLWVRETWTLNNKGLTTSQASVSYKADSEGCKDSWRPSIHMPRWASRMTLCITDVRVARLQAASVPDIIAAGCPHTTHREALHWFRCQWDVSYAKRGYGWEINPWVWLLQFDVMLENVDTILTRNSSSVATNSSGRAANEE